MYEGMPVPQSTSELERVLSIPPLRYYTPHVELNGLFEWGHYPERADHRKLRMQYAYIPKTSKAAQLPRCLIRIRSPP
ncbi:hypothetical protein D3C75_666840 [compost metagenome]